MKAAEVNSRVMGCLVRSVDGMEGRVLGFVSDGIESELCVRLVVGNRVEWVKAGE